MGLGLLCRVGGGLLRGWLVVGVWIVVAMTIVVVVMMMIVVANLGL